jgi:hypothetical protein
MTKCLISSAACPEVRRAAKLPLSQPCSRLSSPTDRHAVRGTGTLDCALGFIAKSRVPHTPVLRVGLGFRFGGPEQ